MNAVGTYNDYQKNAENLTFLCFNIKDYDVAANSVVSETKAVLEDKKVQNNLQNAAGMDIQEVSWGRVIRKGNISSNDSNAFVCAFVEKPTAMELFEKARNMDWRNTQERTFAKGGKVFDYTV